MASRYRTINAAILIVVIGGLVMVGSPAAAHAAAQHGAAFASALEWLDKHREITATVLSCLGGASLLRRILPRSGERGGQEDAERRS